MTLAGILVLYSVFLYVTIRTQFFAETDRELQQVADSLVSPTFEPFRANPSSALEQVMEDFLGPRYQGKMVQLSSPYGKVLFKSLLLKDASLPLGSSLLNAARKGKSEFSTSGILGTSPLRFLTVPLFERGNLVGIVQVGTQLSEEAEVLGDLKIIFAVSLPLSVLVLAYGGWFLAGRALRPVDIVTQSAEQIDDKHLDVRLQVTNPDDEIGRLTRAFNRTLDRIEQAFSRTKRFSVDVSHELRTPLTILKGETEVGLKWAKEPDDFREILNNNLEEINRMSGIIEFLLDISRIEEGRQRLLLEPVSLSPLLAEVFAAFKSQGEEKSLQMSADLTTEAVVKGDEQRLRQLFTQLLHNAITFTPAGGAISLSLRTVDDSVIVDVSDTGIGIPPEDQPLIFDRFYRVDKSRNRAGGGSGLGLSLVKSLVEAQHGSISVVSEPGLGSTFTVFFPRF